jgi:hypothetical protein
LLLFSFLAYFFTKGYERRRELKRSHYSKPDPKSNPKPYSNPNSRATRDLESGEEVTICYDETYDNDRLFVQYGFTLKGNPNDQIFPRNDDIGMHAYDKG